jgi:hypothetical protein
MQREHADLMVLAFVACQFAAPSKEDELVGAIPLNFRTVVKRPAGAAPRQCRVIGSRQFQTEQLNDRGIFSLKISGGKRDAAAS